MAKAITRWKDAKDKTGWWMSNFIGRGYDQLCGVVFANNEWWFFGELYPGFELPVWLRTEEWLGKYLGDKERALEQADGYILSRHNKSQLEHLHLEYPHPKEFREVIRGKSLAFERQIVDEVHEAIHHPSKSRRFAITRENPSPKPTWSGR